MTRQAAAEEEAKPEAVAKPKGKKRKGGAK